MTKLNIERLNITTTTIVVCLCIVCYLSTSCSSWGDDNWEQGTDQPSIHNIAIMADNGVSTRTQIDPSDMKSVMWSKDDKIALWAMDESTSQFSFEASPLSLFYYGAEYSTAIFTGNTPKQEEGIYTYFATYPLPSASAGSSVTITLPSVQSGYYDGEADLMYARGEGQGVLSDDALRNGSLEFSQLTHAIRVEIPKERDLLGATTKLQVIFPEDVVGNATLNLRDENPAITLSEASNSVYVDFDETISEAGYVWLFIKPTTMSGDIEFIGYTKDNIPSKSIIKSVSNREMAAGHITPITLTIPEESYRKVVLTIADNKIGESMKNVTLSAPEGALFAGDLNKITIPADANGNFEFSYSAARYDKAFRSGDISVSFESDHTIVPRSPIRLTEEDKYLVNYRAYTIPYLFEEDFSGVSGTDKYDGLTSQALPGLEKYWTDGRIYGYWNGNCIALRAYYLLGVTYYSYLSLNLDGLTYLKPNIKATFLIECNAEWKKNKIKSMKLKLYDNDNSDNATSVTLSDNSKASSTYIPTKRQLTLPNCSSNMIMVWETDQGSGSGWNPGYDYVYIDNIKISIK